MDDTWQSNVRQKGESEKTVRTIELWIFVLRPVSYRWHLNRLINA